MFSVATWNLENLFRPGGDAGPDTAEAYDAKLSALQDVIERLVPDVLAVQEVGQPEALEDLRARVGADWESALSGLPDGRGIRVGFLSRLPMDEVEHVNAFPAQLAAVQQDDRHVIAQTTGRGLLRVRVHADGEPVDLVTCHLKSKLLTFPGGRFSPRDEGERARFAAYALYRRAAEAVSLRRYADELLDGRGRERAVIVLGDLNDEPHAATTRSSTAHPAQRSAPAGSRAPTKATRRGCGTSTGASSPTRGALAASSMAVPR